MAVIMLLLIQPLLCAVTCLIHNHGSHAAAPTGSHAHHLGAAHATHAASEQVVPVCASGMPAIAHIFVTPTFWPSLLPALLILLTIRALQQRLSPPVHALLISHPLAPPLRPPRRLSV